jgi:hypothetical protein
MKITEIIPITAIVMMTSTTEKPLLTNFSFSQRTVGIKKRPQTNNCQISLPIAHIRNPAVHHYSIIRETKKPGHP